MEPIELPTRHRPASRAFCSPVEGVRHSTGRRWSARRLGPCLEIGSYCGKSTVYLATACRQIRRRVLFAVDHHRGGSEEHQLGEEYHDPALYDRDEAGLMDSFREFRRNAAPCRAWTDTVVPVVAPTRVAARHWRTPLALVFIDGGHSLEAALTDYRCWSGHLVAGRHARDPRHLPDPADGGQAPHTIYRLALASGLYEELPRWPETLGLLRRIL
jgi:hypothetical protein